MKPATSQPIVSDASRRNGTADFHKPMIEQDVPISPDLAHHMLARTKRPNRSLSEARVTKYATVMSRGEWPETYDPIRLDDDGNVRDGQHRLHAIIRSGVTLRFVIVRGLSDAAFDALDRGAPRSIGDVLGIHGYASGKQLSAAVTLLLMFEKFEQFTPKGRESSVGRGTITPAATLAYLEAHPDTEQGINYGYRMKAAKLSGGAGLWGACFTLFIRKDAEAAALFAHHLITGEALTKGHPALLLRNRMMGTDSMRAASQSDRERTAALIIKAWNAFRTGKNMQVLAWRNDGPQPEAFPKPV